MAERFSGHPGFPVVALALHAARLDCLLEAALAAFDLDLIGPAEERETWWWIYSITTRRIQLPLRDTWTAKWAESWSFLAGAMQYVGGCDCFLGSHIAFDDDTAETAYPEAHQGTLQSAAQMGAKTPDTVRRFKGPEWVAADLRSLV